MKSKKWRSQKSNTSAVLELSSNFIKHIRMKMMELMFTSSTSSLSLEIIITSIRLNLKHFNARSLSIKTLLESISQIKNISIPFHKEVKQREVDSDFMILKTLLSKTRTTHSHYQLMFKSVAKVT
jgi:uncharacterized membrane protein YcgQ (UPF0703/DUF1980 family)